MNATLQGQDNLDIACLMRLAVARGAQFAWRLLAFACLDNNNTGFIAAAYAFTGANFTEVDPMCEVCAGVLEYGKKFPCVEVLLQLRNQHYH